MCILQKKKPSFTKKHDEHQTLLNQRSKSFNENDSHSDDQSERKKTRVGLAKTPQEYQHNNTHKLNTLLENLNELGFNNKSQNVDALIQAKYQLQPAINILLNNSEKS